MGAEAEGLAIPVVEIDAAGTLTYANPAARGLLAESRAGRQALCQPGGCGVGAGEHLFGFDLDAETAKFGGVFGVGARAVVRQKSIADVVRAQRLEEVAQAGYGLVAAPQHAVHVDEQVFYRVK